MCDVVVEDGEDFGRLNYQRVHRLTFVRCTSNVVAKVVARLLVPDPADTVSLSRHLMNEYKDGCTRAHHCDFIPAHGDSTADLSRFNRQMYDAFQSVMSQVEALAPVYGNLQELSVVESDTPCSVIGAALSRLPLLRKLRLGGRLLEDGSVLAAGLMTHAYLVELDLREAVFMTEAAGAALAAAICDSCSLEVVCARGSPVRDAAHAAFLETFMDSIERSRSICSVILEGNHRAYPVLTKVTSRNHREYRLGRVLPLLLLRAPDDVRRHDTRGGERIELGQYLAEDEQRAVDTFMRLPPSLVDRVLSLM